MDTKQLHDRVHTIYEAIDLIDETEPARLATYLVHAKIIARFQRDHAALRARLIEPSSVDITMFSVWKASQRLLKAAGRPR